MRRDAREAVYRLLYSYLLTNEFGGENKEYFYKEHKLSNKDVEFADTLICAIKEEIEATEKIISELSISYNIERINYLDRAAIIIAITEIKRFEDIDPPVSVDEAVRLVKKYSTENSLAFVNGILAEYIRRFNV